MGQAYGECRIAAIAGRRYALRALARHGGDRRGCCCRRVLGGPVRFAAIGAVRARGMRPADVRVTGRFGSICTARKETK